MNCCTNYYEVCQKVPDCLTELGIITPVEDSEITLTITDKFKKEYKTTDETESNGLILIDLSDFPEGLLSPYAGNLFVTVYQEGQLVPFIIGGTAYDGLMFSCADVTPVQENYTIDVFGVVSTY
jgi:hypothetical protein